MGWQSLCLLAAVGVVAGFVNVMAGGGSLLTLPVMIFLGLDGPLANGTNRVAVVAQNVAGALGFRQRGYSDWKLSVSLALASVPGAVLGAVCGLHLTGAWFNRVLAGVMVWVMVLLARGRAAGRTTGGGSVARNLLWGHVCMVAIGFYSGFIQAAVGFLLMAVLHRVMGLDLVRVNMHKVWIIGVQMLVALAVFAAAGKVLWGAGLALAAGNATGGYIGSHVSVAGGERVIRQVLMIAMAIMIARLLWMT